MKATIKKFCQIIGLVTKSPRDLLIKRLDDVFRAGEEERLNTYPFDMWMQCRNDRLENKSLIYPNYTHPKERLWCAWTEGVMFATSDELSDLKIYLEIWFKHIPTTDEKII